MMKITLCLKTKQLQITQKPTDTLRKFVQLITNTTL